MVCNFCWSTIQSSLMFRVGLGAGADEGRAERVSSSGADDAVDGNKDPNASKRAGCTFESDDFGPSATPAPAGLTSESGDADGWEADAVDVETGDGDAEGGVGCILEMLRRRDFSELERDSI
jgi:hypothetical protein